MNWPGIDFHTRPVLVREMVRRHPGLEAAARDEIKNMARAVQALGFSDDCVDLIFRANAGRLLGKRCWPAA